MSKSERRPDLTIVIPAYKEAKRVGKTLDMLAEYLKREPTLLGRKVEVIVVVAEASDKTLEIVTRKQRMFAVYSVLRPGAHVGKGRDVRFGMLAAKGRAVLFMDADAATPLRHIAEFYEAYLGGADVVVGVRKLARYRHNLLRAAVSGVGNALFRIAGGIWIEDSQCGFKLFSARATKACFQHLSIMKWGFDMEVLAAAKANRFVIQAKVIEDYKDVPNGTFEDHIVRNSLRALVDLTHIFLRRLTGQYRLRALERTRH